MPIDPKIRSGFNFLSPVYDLGTRLFFGKQLWRTQIHFLKDIGEFNSVLIFGGGTGKILIESLKKNIGTNYYYVDVSDQMIAKAKRKFENFRDYTSSEIKIEFICGSYAAIPSEIKFDLIITPFVLDCFKEEELSIAMRSLQDHLSPNGKWLFADFNIPEKGMIKLFSKITVRTLYFFFNVFCGLGIKKLPVFDQHFKELGFKTEKEKLFLKGMLCTKVYSQ